MIERKDTPAPFMQRQRQPPSPLDIRPHRKHATQSDSPPLTPPPYRVRTRGKRASKAQATPRETYLNGLAGGDNARGGGEPVRNERISHDLSLTNNTRSSVVDSMLLSLNPDQPKIFSTPPENQPLTASSRLTSPRGSHRRGHTQSSSLTDHAIPLDDSPLRSSGQLSRGHRSNSSSDFQSALGRIDSIHGDDEDKPNTINAKILDIQRRTVGERTSEVRTLRKSRKSSKSSGASSVDFGHITGQPRWQSTMTGRSSSFDHGHIRGAYTSSSNPAAHSPTVHDTSRILQYDISDAAPTPTVPAGPRSRDSPVFPPPPSYAPPQMPTIQQKNGVDSSKSYRNRSNRGDLTWESGTVQGGDNTDQRPEGHDVPSVPAFIISRNPSPTRHPQEAFIGHRQATVSHAKDSPKERPGFFRRVFGSSRNPHQSTLEARLPQLQSSQNSIRAESRGGFVSPHKLTKPPPTDDAFHPLKENVPPTLVKKPSSFFRRRKKSISERFPPPALSMRLHPDFQPNPIVPLISQGPDSSPVSSLREVMNLYLSSSVTSQPHHDEESSQAIRSNHNTIFSSDLDPTKATIKPVFPSQESLSGGVAGSPRQHQSADVGPMVQDTPRGGAKPKVDDFLALHSNSFLHDTSSTETKTVQSIDNAGTSNTGLVPSHSGPTSNPTDMVNVDEKQIIDAMSVDPLDDPLRRTREASGKPKVLPSRNEAFPVPSSVSGNASKTLRNQYPRLNSQFTPTAKKLASAGTSDKSARAWLDPDDSEDEFDKLDRMNSHIDVAQTSPASAYHSAASTLPAPWTRDLKDDMDTSDQSLIVDEAKPTDDDRTQARMIYEGEETFVPKATAAAWLGGSEPSRSRVRRAYMELFDWQNLNILVSLRIFCSRLLLKGETQQVDRILDAFSLRWCVCNPNHGFKATGMCS